jgi:Mrp family chromosome partitioning ATPase
MRNDMAKHIPQSLIERAAELYDFGAALRSPAPAPTPTPTPTPVAEPVQAPEPVPVAPPRLLRSIDTPAPRPRGAPSVAEINRDVLAANGLIVPEAQVTGLAEEFRLIKHQLLADIERSKKPEERRRLVLLCSARPKAGKTFCAVNLALSLAGEKEGEVLLVEGDFLKPDALALLGIAGGAPGFVDALLDPKADPESFVIRTDVPGLSVLPAGARTNNVPELLASDRSREVLAKLVAGDRQRIVLFDSPPVLMASHATVLAGLVGRALVVVRADQTTEADLREAIGLLQGCEISLILNGAGLTGRKFGAYDGYGHED